MPDDTAAVCETGDVRTCTMACPEHGNPATPAPCRWPGCLTPDQYAEAVDDIGVELHGGTAPARPDQREACGCGDALVRVEIDLNVRSRGGKARVGYEDATGPLQPGQTVQVHEPETGLAGTGTVSEIDDDLRLAWIDVDWAGLRTVDQPRPNRPTPTCDRCAHAADEHSVYGCLDDCGCPARPDLHQTLVPCPGAVLNQPHAGHSWEPQPGAPLVRCEGHPDGGQDHRTPDWTETAPTTASPQARSSELTDSAADNAALRKALAAAEARAERLLRAAAADGPRADAVQREIGLLIGQTHELRDQVQAGEQRIARIHDKAQEWAALAPPDDWADTPGDTALSDAGRYILALIEKPEPTA